MMRHATRQEMPMSREQNLAAQVRTRDILAAREFDRLGEVFASDVVDHDPGASQGPGVEGVKQFWREFQAAFPDFKEEIDVLTADGDYVTIAYRISGTHQGAYLGIAPTGKYFEIRALQVARYQNAKVKDRWGSSDTLGMLAQLGISIPA